MHRLRVEFHGSSLSTQCEQAKRVEEGEDTVFSAHFSAPSPLASRGHCVVMLEHATQGLLYAHEFAYTVPSPHRRGELYDCTDLPALVSLTTKQVANSLPSPLANSHYDNVRNAERAWYTCTRLHFTRIAEDSSPVPQVYTLSRAEFYIQNGVLEYSSHTSAPPKS